MSVSSTPDYTNAPPLDLAAVKAARDYLEGVGDCPMCDHANHRQDECEVVVGYDHLNGNHECGCAGPDTTGLVTALLGAYNALAARHAMLSAFTSGDPDR
jgi:hypothetical protein